MALMLIGAMSVISKIGKIFFSIKIKYKVFYAAKVLFFHIFAKFFIFVNLT